MNECESGQVCHDNASCTNTFGTFTCQCLEGFEGDGLINCTSKYN